MWSHNGDNISLLYTGSAALSKVLYNNDVMTLSHPFTERPV